MAELHGNNDGTIPATFQVIFMASILVPAPLTTLMAGVTDWLEAGTHPAETSRARFWKSQSKGDSVIHIGRTVFLPLRNPDLGSPSIKIAHVWGYCPMSALITSGVYEIRPHLLPRSQVNVDGALTPHRLVNPQMARICFSHSTWSRRCSVAPLAPISLSCGIKRRPFLIRRAQMFRNSYVRPSISVYT